MRTPEHALSAVAVSVCLLRAPVGERHATFGVDVQAVPIDELPEGVDVQQGADGSLTVPAELLLERFGLRLPFDVRRRHPVTVFHESPERDVLVCRIPGDSNDLNTFGGNHA